jgi:hypothetical protein
MILNFDKKKFIQVAMVILLLFFMNIICVQIPSEHFHKA